MELYGDTEQQTYSGKNLLNPNVYASGTNLYTPTVGTTITNTLSPNVTSSFADQTLSVTTTTSGGALYLSPQLAPGTYHISTTIKSGTNNSARIRANILDSNHIVLRNDDYYTIQTDSSRDIGFNITLASGETYIAITLVVPTTGGGALTATNPQLELGSTATSYEKFVGGTASPNPDYPQDIQVVTGEQTVEVTGKNVASPNSTMVYKNNANIVITPLSTGIQISHPDNGQNKQAIFSTGINLNPYKGKVIRMKSTFDVTGAYRLVRMDSDGNNRVLENYTTTSGTVISLTVPNDLGVSEYLGFQLQLNSSSALVCNFTDLIITIDNADMSYEPYQSQSYTVDLGSTELCKIGDYQDYIYKSGGDWYMHKETLKYVYSDSSQTAYFDSSIPRVSFNKPTGIVSSNLSYCNQFTFGDSGTTNNKFNFGSTRVFMHSNEKMTSSSNWKSWMGQNPVVFYFPLTTPTDTQITDTGLIADLNALAGAKSYLDVTNFSVAATGTNLPALLKPEVYAKSLNGVLEYLSHI